jgi:hypothetical protein
MTVDARLATQYRELRRQWLAAIADHKPASVITAAEQALREFHEQAVPLIGKKEQEQT